MMRANDWLLREPGASDFGEAYLETLDELNAALESQIAGHPIFGPMVSSLTPEQRLAAATDSRARLVKAFEGD